MAHEQVFETSAFRDPSKLSLGHDWERTDVRAAQFGIVIMMMIMRTAPDAAGTQGENPKESHNQFGQTGAGKDGVVLLIVIDHKEPEDQQPAENAAGNFTGEMRTPKSACQAT